MADSGGRLHLRKLAELPGQRRIRRRRIRPPPESITMSPAKLRSMAELTDAVLEAARMVMNPTRPTPIISADALAAVRLGLRMAFWRASFR